MHARALRKHNVTLDLRKQKANHVFPRGRLSSLQPFASLTSRSFCSSQHCPSRLRSHIHPRLLHVTRCLHQLYSDTHLHLIMPTFTSLSTGCKQGNGGHRVLCGHCRVVGICSGYGPQSFFFFFFNFLPLPACHRTLRSLSSLCCHRLCKSLWITVLA